MAKCHNGKPAVVKVKHESWEVRGMAGEAGEAVVHVADGLASTKIITAVYGPIYFKRKQRQV